MQVPRMTGIKVIAWVFFALLCSTWHKPLSRDGRFTLRSVAESVAQSVFWYKQTGGGT